MKWVGIVFCVTVFLSVVSLETARGDYFTIRSAIRTDPYGSLSEIRVNSVNDGPDDVYDLKIVMETPWNRSETLVRPQWKAHEENRVLFTSEPETGAKGRFPLIMTMTFRDRRGLPAVINEVHTFTIGGEDDPMIELKTENTAMDLMADGVIAIKNKSGDHIRAVLRMVCPPSLRIDVTPREIDLAPMAGRTVEFLAVNRYVDPGVVVPVFVLAEYDKGGFHGTVVHKTSLKAVPEHEAFAWRRRALWGLLAISGIGALLSLKKELRFMA